MQDNAMGRNDEENIQVDSLLETALQVRLKVSLWNGYIRDSEIESQIEEDSRAEPDSTSFYKKITRCPVFKDYKKMVSRVRRKHYLLTLPWLDGGIRILPASLLFVYRNEVVAHTHRINEEAERISMRRDEIVEYAKKHLGDLYRESDIPSEGHLKDIFGVSVEYWPMPDVNDWRLQSTKEVLNEMKAKIRAQIAERYDQTVASVYHRLTTALSKLHKALMGKRLHASTVEHFNEIVSLLPALNIWENKELERLHQELVREIGTLDVDSLRKSEHERTKKAVEVNKILSKLQGLRASSAAA